MFSFVDKYLNAPNVLACLVSNGKLFQSLRVKGKKELLYWFVLVRMVWILSELHIL